jgi:alcohol dehydrogenase class IV
VMAANLIALQTRYAESSVLQRYREIARWLTGDEEATAEDGVTWVRQLAADLEIPPLRTYGIGKADFPALVEKAGKASSMKANPLPLTAEELTGILTAAW